MNKAVAVTGAVLTSLSVLLFAIFLTISFEFGSYLVCMFLPIGHIMIVAAFRNECDRKRKFAAEVGTVFAAIYAVLIFLVYFAQTTSVRNDSFNEQAMRILDYSRGGLLFHYDLLGYGMMALSTFFIGLTVEGKTKTDKWLKYLMIAHGVFFFGCFIMPMTGVFQSMSEGGTNRGGVIALEFWCAYFFPVGVLSAIHFARKSGSDPVGNRNVSRELPIESEERRKS